MLQRPVRLSELGSAVETMRQSRLRQHALRDYVERQETLRRELNHRVKNVLATVQALHALTVVGAADLDAFSESFEGRLEAMAGVHQVLHDNDYGASELASIVDVILAPYRGAGGVEVDGERTPLEPEVAQGLALVLHELATNASKYGALSGPGGRVRLSWGVADGRFEAVWTERDGPAVAPPGHVGYGTRFIEATMQGYGGTAASTTRRAARASRSPPPRRTCAPTGPGSRSREDDPDRRGQRADRDGDGREPQARRAPRRGPGRGERAGARGSRAPRVRISRSWTSISPAATRDWTSRASCATSSACRACS